VDERSPDDKLQTLLEVYAIERQEEHQSGMSGLTLVTIGVAYITAAVALAARCRRGLCEDEMINLSLLLLPLAPIAILGFLVLNFVNSSVRGRGLREIERAISGLLKERIDARFMIPSYPVGFMYRFRRKDWPYMVVNIFSVGTLFILVTLFIVGVFLSAEETYQYRWIFLGFYLMLVVLELIVVVSGLRGGHWRRLQKEARSSLEVQPDDV
jgi:hypothetical protein